jgi:hypothetical protein
MTEIERQLVLLVKHNVEFVIIGGVAATLYGSSYLTHDLDVCYARDGANLKSMKSSDPSVPSSRLIG